MAFIDMLERAWQRNNSLLCVGLDPDVSRFPSCLADRPDAIFLFCKGIVDATAHLVCAFKPQIAYFSSLCAEDQLMSLIAYIHRTYPDIPVILDAKRGDIGSTAAQYAREAFERFNADALTVNPYMGLDSIEPYFDYPERGVIVLCRTSNPGGGDLQNLDLLTGGKLYQHVAQLVATQWNHQGQVALVVGATFPEELAQVRDLVGDLPLLVPGVGAQGAQIKATVAAGKNSQSTGLMINSSRAILYASKDDDYLEAAQKIAQQTRDEINLYR